jgi:hypothetical protein
MKKLIVFLSILFISALLLIECSNNEEKLSKVNIKQLTRVDVQTVKSDESYDEAVMITDKATVDLLRETFEQIEWEQNVKAEMDRWEDVKVTLFFSFDKNMPEKLVEYFIWFNQGNETATIIDRDEHAYGTLDKKNAKTLKEIMLEK